MASAGARRPYPPDVTDAQWALLEPLLPAPGNTAGHGGRPEKHDRRRRMLDAIFHLVPRRAGLAAVTRGVPARQDRLRAALPLGGRRRVGPHP